MWETWVHFLGWEDPPENGTATHSSILAWRIPWTIRIGHNGTTFTFQNNVYYIHIIYIMLYYIILYIFSSVQFSCSVMSDSLRSHESQHARPPCPSHLPEFTQTHVHRVGDAIQTFHPPSSPSPPAPIPSQHQSFPMSKLFT